MADQREQDIFISHAHADKAQYIDPLTDALSTHNVTFWLDTAEIAWGDSVMGKINEGFRTSRFALICLSSNFLRRPWPEAEFGAALSIQNTNGVKRVLPLILNAKDEVLKQYPLLVGLAFREFDLGPAKIASEISRIASTADKTADDILITVEGAHTGKLCRLNAPRRASLQWLVKMARASLNLEESFKVSPFSEFRLRWVLVDTELEREWLSMPRLRQREIHALVRTDQGTRLANSTRDRLDELGVRDGTIFHMYAIEDEDFDPPSALS